MSVPSDMMARLAQQKPPMQPGGAPGGAPMATPEPKKGKLEAARVNVHIAMNMLEQALPAFGSESKEGKAILKHLSGLSKDFGNSDASDLIPADVRQMVGEMPQMGGGTEQQKMLMQQMMKGGGQGGQPQPGQPQQPPMQRPGMPG